MVGFFGFRGGKGIATTIGVLLWLAPIPTVIAGVICLIAIALTRYVSLGSLILTVLVPVIMAIWFMQYRSCREYHFGIVVDLSAPFQHISIDSRSGTQNF
ncbi:hypothetical protein GCM10025858_02500 [Alicyclobacillus sacchari]|uniref:glycerol-3-phosphate acyltransferase n=1 Tax=Alicyclobacillus sacchari TaxID=392010 RepID=UPI0023E9E55E|nr:hypothetical protein GCM10025858_02500 [Alicyclobacillus sacchari]